ncbi:MAG TPA: phosphatidylglycerol lysyltransferase domain-containing protein, partial [Candidatus Limnocylindrales bacterium]
MGKLAPAVMFGIVALGAMSYLFTFPRPIANAVAAVLPIDLNDADPTFGILSAVGLGALSVGLLRGKQVAWWLALATVAATLFGQSDLLQHPVRTAVVGGVLAVLVADRRRYKVETDAGWRRIIVALLVVVAVAVGLETSLIIASTGRWPAPLTMLSDATAAIGGAFGIDDDTAAGLLRGTSFNVLLGLLLLAARLPMVLAAIGVLARVPEAPPDPSTRARARQIGARYGRGALLPFQLGDDKLLYCPSDADGCIVYGLAGRTAVVVGDPIAADDSCLAVLDAFRDQSHRFDRKVTFYQASDAMRASLERAGFY